MITFLATFGAFLLFTGILLDAIAKALRNDGYGNPRSLDRLSIWANLLGAGMVLISVADLIPFRIFGLDFTPLGVFISLLLVLFVTLIAVWLLCVKKAAKQPSNLAVYIWYFLFRWNFAHKVVPANRVE